MLVMHELLQLGWNEPWDVLQAALCRRRVHSLLVIEKLFYHLAYYFCITLSTSSLLKAPKK